MSEQDIERITTRYEAQPCPVCKNPLDSAAPVDGVFARPGEGDAIICVLCTSFLAFGEGLKLRAMTDSDVADLPDDIRIQLQRARRALDRVRSRE